MDYKESYEAWLAGTAFDEDSKRELRAIAGNEKEIEDRFYKSLDFGTGGLRGILGAGTNRMNVYTVGRATQGLANYILKQGAQAARMGVVIAHDSRHMSPEFSRQAALVLAANGIKAYVFDSLRPTPVLSFAVRHLGCTAGVVITASHNPKEYNGYKVYWSDGGQVTHPRDADIIAEVNAVTDFARIQPADFGTACKEGLYCVVGASLDDAYAEAVKAHCLNSGVIAAYGKELVIVYSPLNGAGNVPVRRVLKETGFEQVYVVPEQELPDPDFPTLDYPNPEDPKAFTLALAIAYDKDADMILATDPDSDRLGCMVKNDAGEYVVLTGNMIGTLMLEYLLSQKRKNGTLPENGAVISTIVSTDLTKAVADAYGVTVIDVLTGFKYIGEKMKEFEETGEHTFLFGFEESNGTLGGTYARDKDAVLGALMMCEIAAHYKSRGLSVYDGLNEIYEKYGYYRESIETITLKGVDGLARIIKTMDGLRANPPGSINGARVCAVSDYKNGVRHNLCEGKKEAITLPLSDVLYYELSDGAWFCVRPSGTEPKIKVYFGVKGENHMDAAARLQAVSEGVMAVVLRTGE